MKLLIEQWRNYQEQLELEKELLEEGWRDKLTKGLAGLALAGGLGLGAPSKAQAQDTGTMTSVERPLSQVEILSSDVERKIVSDFNNLKLKNRFAEPIVLKRSDVTSLAKTVSKMAISRGHQKGVDKYAEVAVRLLKIGVSEGADVEPVIEYVEGNFAKRIKKEKKEPKSTVTSYEVRDNPRIIQQSVMGVWMTASQGGSIDKALDKLTKNLVRGIKDGDITREDAQKILKLVNSPDNSQKIDKILGLQ